MPSGSGPIRKTGVALLGGVVTAAGLVMLVTPGPGVLVALLGLGILGKEFPAAQRRLQRLRPDRQRKEAKTRDS